MLWRRGRAFLKPQRAMAYGFAGGVMSVIAYWLVIWAMTLAPLGPVAVASRNQRRLRRPHLGLIMKEGWLRHVAAACVVAAGVILLKV